MSGRNPVKSMLLALATSTLLFALPAFAVAQPRLLPAPREAHFAGETALPASIAVSVPGHDPEDEFAARDLEEAVKAAGLTGKDAAAYQVVLLRRASAQAKALLAKRGLAFDAAMDDEG